MSITAASEPRLHAARPKEGRVSENMDVTRSSGIRAKAAQ
jgi:hypothetical protein